MLTQNLKMHTYKKLKDSGLAEELRPECLSCHNPLSDTAIEDEDMFCNPDCAEAHALDTAEQEATKN